MTSSKVVWVAAGFIALGAGALWSSAATESSPAGKWEYKFDESFDTPPTATANQMGANGWELVSATVQDKKYILYYKRPK